MQRPRLLLPGLVLSLACWLTACDALKQSIPTPTPSPSESPSPSTTPNPTPTPVPSPIRNSKIVGFFDLAGSGDPTAIAPWLTFSTGGLSFTGGNVAIQQRQPADGGAAEYGLIFGSDVERQYLDLLSTTPLDSIINLPSTGWIPAQDFNLLTTDRYYGLKLSNGNVQFAIHVLTSRNATIDYVFQPVDKSTTTPSIF